MHSKAKNFSEFTEYFIKVFNFLFFVVSAILWLILTIKNVMTHAFTFDLLWSAFNEMYGQFSFKVGCIGLIIFNGLSTIRGFLNQYIELKENAQHTKKLHQFVRELLKKLKKSECWSF